jgi:hypothetical protein
LDSGPERRHVHDRFVRPVAMYLVEMFRGKREDAPVLKPIKPEQSDG